MTRYIASGNGHGRVAARQVALEPATGGADRAMSWTGWLIASNIGNQNQRVLTNSSTSSGATQYALSIVNSDEQTGLAGKLSFTLFNTGQTANLTMRSSEKILRQRLYHFAITYDGSATVAGFKLYLNGVEDTTASKTTTGTYTTAGQDAAWRYQTGYVNGAATFQSYRGRQKNHTIWNRVLTQAEVTDLVTLLGGDVTTLPFYAAAVTAHWPLATDAVCANNATFNFGTLTNITFDTFPFGLNYKFISTFNGVIPNTRYLAFGTMYKSGDNQFVCKTRSGTDHITGGKIISLTLNSVGNMSVSAPVDIITSANDIRQASAGELDGNKVTIFAHRYTSPNLISAEYYDSTDGLTGLTFGSANDYSSILPVGFGFGLPYGKLIPGYVAGEYVVPWYSGDVGGNSEVGLLKRSSGGVWSYVPIYSGTTDYGEPCILRAEDNTYVVVMRLVGGNGLHMTYSTDDGATWSAPAATGLGSTGECMADICMMPNTRNIVLCWADRTLNVCSLSTGNRLADIIADPTDWSAASDIFQRYAFTGGINKILGYPSIVPDGYNVAGCVSAERTATAADLYFFYGQVDFAS